MTLPAQVPRQQWSEGGWTGQRRSPVCSGGYRASWSQPPTPSRSSPVPLAEQLLTVDPRLPPGEALSAVLCSPALHAAVVLLIIYEFSEALWILLTAGDAVTKGLRKRAPVRVPVTSVCDG